MLDNAPGRASGVGVRAFALVVAASAVLGGCKSSDTGGTPSSSGAKAAEDGAPARGGTVRIPSNEPKYLNPILEPRFVVANDLIFEGLVGLDAKGEPVPRLAESWDVSADGLTVTFHLRSGVKWHDGQPFTSADVAFTFEAIRSTNAATAWKTYMAPVKSVTTPDERTVVVAYVAPFAPALATWTVGILPRHAFVKADAAAGAPIDLTEAPANLEPIGTGPFRYQRWELGKRLLLEANAEWWHKRPHLDGVELVFGIGEGQVVDALRQGRIDWARVADVESWLQLGQDDQFRSQYEASEVVEPRLRMIAWNTQRAPLDDKRVRKALTLALDRQRVIGDLLYGQAQAIGAPFFPTMFGYDPSVAPLPFDLDAARTLLASAARPAVPGTGRATAPSVPGTGTARISIECISVDSFRGAVTDGMAAIFQKDLASIGVDFKLTLLPAKEYYERVARRDYDAVYFGWLPDIPDPDPAALLHSTQAQAGANYAAYANPDVDKLVEQARTTLDRDARQKLYEQLQRMLADELPYTPLFAPYGHYAWNRRVHGVTPRDVVPQAPLPGIAGWWVSRR